MGPPLTTTGLDADGVSLLSPYHPTFDALARPLIGSLADRVYRMAPMLAGVTNHAPRTIVALSLTWTVTRPVGGLTHRTNAMFPDVVVGDGLESRRRAGIRPGESHVLGAGCVVERFDEIPENDSWIEHFAEEADRAVAGASAVHIQLDAAIFEDGALAGDDRDGWISALFGNYVRAKQEWYRGIRLALADGGSADDAFAPIREFQMDFQRRMHGGQVRDLLRDPLHVPRVQAAAEAQSWRRRVGDQRIAEAAQALRLEPFVLVRRP